MVNVHYSDHFRRRIKKLSDKQQARLAELIILLQENPYHPQLHTKTLSGELAGVYSFRITRELRTLFKFLSPDAIMLIDIGNRKDIYR